MSSSTTDPGNAGPSCSVQAAATQFALALANHPAAGLDADGLARRIAILREVQSSLEGDLVASGLRADQLAAQKSGAPARDALLGTGRVRGATARREANRAKLAGRSALIARAMSSGRFSPDHLDSLVRRLLKLDDQQLAGIELTPLLTSGADLPADTFDAALRSLVDLALAPGPDDGLTEPEPEPNDESTRLRAESSLHHWLDHRTGLGHISATLDPERYETVVNAIDRHVNTLANKPEEAVEKNANLAAQAFHELICSPTSGRQHPAHITVVVDHETMTSGRHRQSICETGHGHGVADDALSRMVCDATVRRVVTDKRGLPIDVGRAFRTATDAQWAALTSIYRGCAWSGCDRPLSFCQAHHLRPWSKGGRTDLANLVPLCSHHHHLAHEGGWNLELLPDRSLRLTRPDGAVHCITRPPTRRPPPLEVGRPLLAAAP
jgi:hypothetical protein